MGWHGGVVEQGVRLSRVSEVRAVLAAERGPVWQIRREGDCSERV